MAFPQGHIDSLFKISHFCQNLGFAAAYRFVTVFFGSNAWFEMIWGFFGDIFVF